MRPVESEIRVLEQAGVFALSAEWRRLFGGEPPRLSRDLLVRALAYRVQERAMGGLSRASPQTHPSRRGAQGDANADIVKVADNYLRRPYVDAGSAGLFPP